MLPVEIALILAEVSATQLPYNVPNRTRKPLIDRRAERLIQWLILLNLPPLFFSTRGLGHFWLIVVTIVFAPSAIIEAAQASQLIQYFDSQRHLWRRAQMLRIINVLLLLTYTTCLAIIPLLSINRA